MEWLDFIVCLFFGVLGVHKFREKKIGMGLLYLFTGGLFGFGWLIDCIKYAKKAIDAQNKNTTYDNICTNESGTTSDKKEVSNPKKVGLWILTVLLIIIALGFLPSFASILALVCAALAIPIEQWQSKLSKYIKGTYKTIAIVALVILTLITAPSSETADPSLPTNTIPTTETTEWTDYIGESTSATAPNTGTDPNETTDVPVTEAATIPTNTPTTTPATDPTTVPTTEPPHVHSFSNATCTSPKTCSCGATEGSANGHSWNNATCTSPKTCSFCSTTEGSATGHYYANGVCSSCGKSDPDYVDNSNQITYVLNTKSKKFHRLSCRKLPTENRKDTTMSREEIIDAGYDPCGICHP